MDEEIEKRIAEMQKYFPFVKATIEWLQDYKDKDTREFLLRKMQGFHWILSGVPVGLTIEQLQQSENVLQKMDSIIKSHPRAKRWYQQNNGIIPQSSTPSENEKSDQYKKTAGQPQDAEIDIKIEEMLASLDINPSS